MILVIDGMGGGIGKAVIEHLKGRLKDIKITAVGTNSIATAAMLKAGADVSATGENAVIYNCTRADYIIGTLGIVFANSMHGEISPRMAAAVSSSAACKILIPMDKCNATVLGVADRPVQEYINEIAGKIIDNNISTTKTE
ncbi:MAG: DUF3842 family protein [Holophagaceae bacterium]|nr:DUF3842 family protein [Holophagaceae bacterium]